MQKYGGREIQQNDLLFVYIYPENYVKYLCVYIFYACITAVLSLPFYCHRGIKFLFEETELHLQMQAFSLDYKFIGRI